MLQKIDNHYDLENHLLVQHFCEGGIHKLDFTEEEVVEAREAFDDYMYPLKMETFLGIAQGTLEHLIYMFRSCELSDEYIDLLNQAWDELPKMLPDARGQEMPRAIN